MTSTPFDPQQFKTTQRVNWNAMSAGWLSWQDKFERGAAAVTERLLKIGGVRPGMRVLDIGTGIGEPALTAAKVVGPTGHVTGIDLAAEMVEIARRRATGMSQVEFTEGDVESLALPADSYDVVLSRWGLMFAVNRVRALRAVAKVLVPGGVLAAAVWGPPETALMVNRGFRALSERLQLPPAPDGEPHPYDMADPAQDHAELTEAGLTEVSITEFDAPFWLHNTDEYVEFYRTCSPPGLLNLIQQKFGSADNPDIWAAVGASVEPYRTADGRIDLPSRALLIHAEKPATP